MTGIIVAVCANGAIGRRGDLIHHVSADLRRFKQLTVGHTVVMGRCTFDSLPKGALPQRRNIVVTRQEAFSAPGVEVAHSLDEALQMARGEDVYVIGGAEIYRQALPLAERLLLTRFADAPADADTFFPEIDASEWHVTESSTPTRCERTGVEYWFETLERI